MGSVRNENSATCGKRAVRHLGKSEAGSLHTGGDRCDEGPWVDTGSITFQLGQGTRPEEDCEGDPLPGADALSAERVQSSDGSAIR